MVVEEVAIGDTEAKWSKVEEEEGEEEEDEEEVMT